MYGLYRDDSVYIGVIEGIMKKNMETTIRGYMGTTIGIHSFNPS